MQSYADQVVCIHYIAHHTRHTPHDAETAVHAAGHDQILDVVPLPSTLSDIPATAVL